MPSSGSNRKKSAKQDYGRWLNVQKQIDGFCDDVKLPGTWTQEDYREFQNCFAELLKRERETVYLYAPLPTGDLFHRCLAHEVGLSGSNRAGKTCTASAEVGMAATGTHYVDGKYPRENVQIACVGNDGRHLSLMYEYLFEKAPFKIFQHPVTFKWMVVVEDEHQEFKHLWQEAEPMIPERLIKGGLKKGVSWENAKEKIPKSVRLVNGTIIRFYSGLVRKMPQGRKFHLVWMDEEIDQAKKWLDEMRARIVDLNGRIFWSATPQNGTVEFQDMQDKSEDPENASKPLSQQTAFFVMQSAENKFISGIGREAFRAKMEKDDEQMQIRYFGKSARSFLSVYPEFTDKHIVKPMTLRWEDTRYLIFDPGVDVAAVLFVCSPQQENDPEKLAVMSDQEKWYRTRPGCLVCYDELYIRRANAQAVAIQTKMKLDMHPRAWVQDLTIDKKGSKSVIWKGMKEDEDPGTIYMEALLKYGITPKVSGWQYGSYEVTYGIERTKDYLCPSADDHLPMLFITDNCKKLIWEMKVWKKVRNNAGEFVDYEKGNNHLLDCLRYATTRGLQWVPPPQPLGPRPFARPQMNTLLRNIKSGKAFYN